MKEIEVSAAVENLDEVLGFLEQGLEDAKCTMKEQTQIAVAAEEIFVNIAHYAYAEKNGKATIRYEIREDPSCIMIMFIDSGIPYNPLEKPDPDVSLPSDKREIGGLGIYMAKKMMDSVEYQMADHKNILILKKNLTVN